MQKHVDKIVLEFQNGERLENAGSKAPADVSTILVNNGFRKVFVTTSGASLFEQFFSLLASSVKLVVSAKRGSILLCQYPVYSKKGAIAFGLMRVALRAKRVKIILLIHDLISARTGAGKEKEIMELNKNDGLIVHTPEMASFLVDSGYTKPYVILGLFDYLVKIGNNLPRRLSKTIAYAGNLSKSGFINRLDEMTHETMVRFVLYGRNDQDMTFSDRIEYHGLFQPDDVSSLEGSWGLVWDGPSIDELAGEAGLYQKINSPHKASLYLVARLPLIVSTEAAIAKIVVEEKIGIAVHSLRDIEAIISGMSESDYAEMLANVEKYAERLKSGSNLMTAVGQCQNI